MFIQRPTCKEDRTHNFQRYLTGYPWIVVAEDNGGLMRYLCGICRKGATVTHIHSEHHIGKTCHNFPDALGHSIPVWVRKFKGFDTKAEHLFDEYEYGIWPPVCTACNADLADTRARGCSFCRPSAMPASASAGHDGDEVLFADTGKRFRPTDANTYAGSASTGKPKLIVTRPRHRDFREEEQASGSSQIGTHKEVPPTEDSQGAHGRRHSKREVDSQLAVTQPRCPDEPRLRKGYVRDLEKYVREHKRLFSMDYFSPYGPWSTDFTEWTFFFDALYKSSRETTTMDTHIGRDTATGSIVITPARRWEIHPKVGEWIVISRTHPTMDRIVAGQVTKVNKWSFIEWKTQWGRFEEVAEKVQLEVKRCPEGHFRVDMEVENISIARVEHALRTLTEVRGMETHNVTVLSPIQAMMVLSDFMASDIKRINDAGADRRRQEDRFTPVDGYLNDKRDKRYGASDASGASDAHGASDARLSFSTRGASDANTSGSKSSSHDTTRSGKSSLKSRRHVQEDAESEAFEECWVRPRMYVRPPSDWDFESACSRAGLNDVQRHAMTVTGKHRLVLVRGPPGTGKTQMSHAVIDAWARNVSNNDIVIAAGPSNTATDNLLDRSASLKDRKYRIGRLGEGKSV